jgi:hypothetical protein
LSKIKLRTDHMQANKEENMGHIDYISPVNDPEKQRQYSQLIAREGTQVEEWQSLLQSSISIEKYIFFLQKVRCWNEEGHVTVPLVQV